MFLINDSISYNHKLMCQKVHFTIHSQKYRCLNNTIFYVSYFNLNFNLFYLNSTKFYLNSIKIALLKFAVKSNVLCSLHIHEH